MYRFARNYDRVAFTSACVINYFFKFKRMLNVCKEDAFNIFINVNDY